MININNLTIIDCKVGIKAPKTANMSINGAYFERVETCYDFHDVPYTASVEQKISSLKNIKMIVKNNNASNLEIERKSKEIIQNLFNLEITSKINKDLDQVKKIRKIKGLVGSKSFNDVYSTLNW